eukprot:11660039-Prorocentrum_lima.AAC.1
MLEPMCCWTWYKERVTPWEAVMHERVPDAQLVRGGLRATSKGYLSSATWPELRRPGARACNRFAGAGSGAKKQSPARE